MEPTVVLPTEFVTEIWDSNDPRLPLSENVDRIPPDKAFIDNVCRHGVLVPICVGLLPDGGWVLVYGRKRLLAARECQKDIRVQYAEMTMEQAYLIGLIENAQRSNNPISDFLAIRQLLHNGMGYEQIGKLIGKGKVYVKGIDDKLGLTPEWALDAALDGKIVITVLEELGKLARSQQDECHDYFVARQTLPMSAIDDMKRVMKQSFATSFAASPSIGGKSPFVARATVEKAYELLVAGKKAQGMEILRNLLG